MQPYQFCLKEKDQLTTNTFESDQDSRVEHLCQLIQDAGDAYVSLIFEDHFNAVKRSAFIRSLYKPYTVKSGIKLICKYWKCQDLGILCPIYERVNFHYNKCPFCDKQFKMINYQRETDPEGVKSSKMKGPPQPGKAFIKHLCNMHKFDFKISIKQKNFMKYVTIY